MAEDNQVDVVRQAVNVTGVSSAVAEKLSEDDWKAIQKTMQPGMDEARVRSGLERLKADKSSPEERAAECEKRASCCRGFLYALPQMESIENQAALATQLRQQAAHDTGLAKCFREIAKDPDRQWLGYCEIIWLWESVGGTLTYESPKVRHETSAGWDPQGPVIEYFLAAAKAVFNISRRPTSAKDIVIKYKKRSPFRAATFGGAVEMLIDDSEVFIIRDGERVDGTGG